MGTRQDRGDKGKGDEEHMGVKTTQEERRQGDIKVNIQVKLRTLIGSLCCDVNHVKHTQTRVCVNGGEVMRGHTHTVSAYEPCSAQQHFLSQQVV